MFAHADIPLDYHAIACAIAPAPSPSEFGERPSTASVRALAHELLNTRDAADFADCLDAMVTDVDSWALPEIVKAWGTREASDT